MMPYLSGETLCGKPSVIGETRCRRWQPSLDERPPRYTNLPPCPVLFCRYAEWPKIPLRSCEVISDGWACFRAVAESGASIIRVVKVVIQ